MPEIEFTSSLSGVFRDTLEELMFFNPQQEMAEGGVVDAIDQFGMPEIIATDDGVRVGLGGHDVQALFAIAQSGDTAELAGMILYLRTDAKNVTVVHVAVTERFSAAGADGGAMLVMRLVQAVERCARRLNGVEQITILYSQRARVLTVGRDRRSTRPAGGASMTAPGSVGVAATPSSRRRGAGEGL